MVEFVVDAEHPKRLVGVVLDVEASVHDVRHVLVDEPLSQAQMVALGVALVLAHQHAESGRLADAVGHGSILGSGERKSSDYLLYLFQYLIFTHSVIKTN